MFGALYFGQGYFGLLHIEVKPTGFPIFYIDEYVPQNTEYTDLYNSPETGFPE